MSSHPDPRKKTQKKVNDWAFQWKMSFHPDPRKKAQEVIFSSKSKRSTHPLLVFNNNNVSQTCSQKHLGVILDFKLAFEEHLNNVLAKVNKAVGLVGKLRNIFITKNNANYYIQSFHSVTSGLW